MSIRKIGKNVLTYFEELIVFSLVVMFLYMHLQLSYSVSISSHSPFFDLNLFLEGFFYLFPDVAVGTMLCAIYYNIRHKQTLAEALVGYLIICIVVWLVIVPIWLMKFPSYGKVEIFQEYDDPVVSQLIQVPQVFRFLVERVTMLHRASLKLASMGYASVLLVLPFGVAVSSLAGICSLSSWRFVNLLSIGIFFILIMVSNSYLYDERFLQSHELFSTLRSWTSVLFNFFIAAVFIVLGTATRVSRHRNINREDEL